MIINSKLNTQSSEVDQDIFFRLHRIKGQIDGIEKMIGEGKDCTLVLHQIMAARSALGKVATKLLTQETCRCDIKRDPQELEKIIDELIKIQ